MRRRRLATLAILLGVALFSAHVYFWKPFAVVGPAPDDGYFRVPGVVHVHTTASDGGGSPEEVIAAARVAGLRFVAITDHNNLDAKKVEGYRDGLLVLVGTEVSTNAGHIVGLGIADPVFRFSGDAHDALQDIHDLGGIAFAAHPLSRRSEFLWTGWDQPGDWGIELLNGDSQWRAAGWWRLLRTLALYSLNPRYALLSGLTAPDETLRRWDAMLRDRDVAGIVGADAHSRVPIRKQTSLRFPSYEALFGLARNYVLLDRPLTGRASDDISAIVRALGRGRSYVGVDALGPASGFLFVAERGSERWTMGDTVPAGPGLRLRTGGALPKGARVRLLKDGQVLRESEERIVLTDATPGVFRVEVRIPGWEIPWVLSNPIVVADPDGAERRRRRAAWPELLPAPEAVEMLDRFEGQTAFRAASDPTSQIDKAVIDPHGGEDGGGAARIAFHVSAAQKAAFCAIVDYTHRDFSGRHGLVFKVKADGVYRVWFQVRDENPASAEEGIEWWFDSVKTDTTWRRVAVPFSRLRSIDPKTDGRLDLDKVRALVFVLDRGAIKPGTAGTIWIDDFGVY